MERNWKHRWLQLIVIAVMLLPGCSLINPHVSWDEPPSRSSTSGGDTHPGGAASTPAPGAVAEKYSLAWSIDYAENAKKAYKEALGNQSRLASLLGIGLIPLSAATLGLGILDKSHTDMVWMGLAAASGYAVGSWLYSKPQQRAYVAGYNATSCAIDAILPLRYVMNNSVKKDLNDLYSHLAVVATAVSNVNSVLGEISSVDKNTQEGEELTRKANQPAGRKIVRTAEEAVKAAELHITAAKEATAKGRSLDFQARSAGMSLKEAVDRISGQVSGVIIETGPDIQALAQVIGGLAGSYGQFVKVPNELKTAAAPKAQAETKKDEDALTKLESGTVALNNEALNLSVATHKMTDLLNTVAASKPVEALKSCGVSADKIAIALTIDPPGPIDLDEKAASSAGRVIQGGTAPYAVAFQGSEAEGLSVRQTEPFGPAFVVQSSANTPAGNYTLYVSDRAGNRQFVTVRVKAVLSSGGGREPSTNQTASAPPQLAENLKTKSFDIGQDFTCLIATAEATTDKKLKLLIQINKKAGGELTDRERAQIPRKTIIKALRTVDKNLKSMRDEEFVIERRGSIK